MIGKVRRLWPRSLAARLVLLLIVALALAQLALALVLHGERDNILEQMGRSQALSQTVTLARLLATSPIGDQDRLAQAFGSRKSCARVDRGPPPPRAMNPSEQRLADTVAAMLHGVGAGTPMVAIEPFAGSLHGCAGFGEVDGPSGTRPSWQEDAPPPDAAMDGDLRPQAMVTVTVPLPDERWLSMRTILGFPGGWNRIALLSFFLSSVAVCAVAVIVVRSQTRSLRALAAASERLGRGETVEPLRAEGPSESAAAIHAFNTMQERLGQFLRDRLRLLAGISHDLRTPLTTLRLKAEFVEDEALRDDIIATIEELTAICETTLAFTRAEATSEATEKVDLAALVGDITASFRLAGEDVISEPSAPLLYPCRPVALKRALRNLVENAVRYAGNARVALRDDTAAVIVTIDDDGPGLPAEQIEDAFQPFVRLEPSRNTETGGIGLGLSIARSIVKAHGGTLTLANRPEGGLRAEIRLPR